MNEKVVTATFITTISIILAIVLFVFAGLVVVGFLFFGLSSSSTTVTSASVSTGIEADSPFADLDSPPVKRATNLVQQNTSDEVEFTNVEICGSIVEDGTIFTIVEGIASTETRSVSWQVITSEDHQTVYGYRIEDDIQIQTEDAETRKKVRRLLDAVK